MHAVANSCSYVCHMNIRIPCFIQAFLHSQSRIFANAVWVVQRKTEDAQVSELHMQFFPAVLPYWPIKWPKLSILSFSQRLKFGYASTPHCESWGSKLHMQKNQNANAEKTG